MLFHHIVIGNTAVGKTTLLAHQHGKAAQDESVLDQVLLCSCLYSLVCQVFGPQVGQGNGCHIL